jgi:hypothetical protein
MLEKQLMIDRETVRQEERAARDLDILIERRVREESAQGGLSPQALTDAERRLRLGKEQARQRWEWSRYHRHLETLHTEIAAEHRIKAAALLEEPWRVRT